MGSELILTIAIILITVMSWGAGYWVGYTAALLRVVKRAEEIQDARNREGT